MRSLTLDRVTSAGISIASLTWALLMTYTTIALGLFQLLYP